MKIRRKVNFNLSLILILFSIIFFLYLNLKKKVFLGDSGANLLSVIIAMLFIKNFNINYLFKSDEILMIMLLPGLEIIRVFYLRISNKKNPFKADRNHLHYLILDKFKAFNVQKNKKIHLLLKVAHLNLNKWLFNPFPCGRKTPPISRHRA